MKPVKPNLGTNEEQLSTGVYVAAYRSAEHEGVTFVVSRWELTYEERQAVARGQDVFLIQSTADDTVTPALLLVGPEAFHEAIQDPPSSETVPTDSEGEEDPSRFTTRTSEML